MRRPEKKWESSSLSLSLQCVELRAHILIFIYIETGWLKGRRVKRAPTHPPVEQTACALFSFTARQIKPSPLRAHCPQCMRANVRERAIDRSNRGPQN